MPKYDDMVRIITESFDKACETIKNHEESCEICEKVYMCAESQKMHVILGDIELLYYKYAEK